MLQIKIRLIIAIKIRVFSKILKLENNQHGFAVTKPLPAGFIKKVEVLSSRKSGLMLESLDHDDKIGYLFVADIHFDHKNATSKCNATFL